MAFKGDTRQIPLLSIFQTLALNDQRGILSVNSDGVKRRILFTTEGVRLLVNYRGDPEPLKHIVVKLKLVTESQFQNVLSTKKDDNIAIGDFFVNRRIIDAPTVSTHVASHLLELLYDTFSWKEARYEFVAQAPSNGLEIFEPDTFATDITFRPNAIMMEVARREDEWERIRQTLTSNKEIYTPISTQKFLEPRKYESEVPDEAILEVKKLINGENTLEKISDGVTISLYETYQTVIQLKASNEIRSLGENELHELADKLRKKFRIREVIDIYHRLLKKKPGDISTRLNFITILESKEQFKQELSGQYEELAKHFLEEEEPHTAREYITKLLDIVPDSLFGLETLFDLQIDSRLEKEASVTSRTLLESAKRNGEYERAVAVFEKVIKAFPEDAAFHHELADLHQYSGYINEAVDSLKRVAAIHESRNDLVRLLKICERIATLDRSEEPKRHKVQELLKKNSRTRASSIAQVAALSVILTFFFGVFYWLILEVLCRQSYAASKIEVEKFVANQQYEEATATLNGIRKSYPLTVFSFQIGQEVQKISRRERELARKHRKQVEENNLQFSSVLAQVETLLGRRKYLDALHKIRDIPKEHLSKTNLNSITGFEKKLTKLFLEAKSILNSARSLTRAGKHLEAHEFYLKLLQDYPNTPSTQGLKTPLALHTYPPGAEIYVNGSKVGQSPLLVHFDPFAEFSVRIKKKGFEEFQCSNIDDNPCVDFTRDWALTVKMTLAPQWSFDANASIDGAPVFDDRMAFVNTRKGETFGVDLSSGKPLWSYSNVDNRNAGSTLRRWKDLVFFGTSDGFLIGLDKGSGKGLLKVKPHQSTSTRIYPSEANDRGIIAVAGPQKVSGVDLGSGSVIWSASPDRLLNSPPVRSRDNFVCFTSDGKILELDGQHGGLVRSVNLTTTLEKPGVVFGNSVFLADSGGSVHRVRLETGKTEWTYKSVIPDLSSPSVGDEILVCGSRNGKLLALDIQGGNKVWGSQIQEGGFVVPGLISRNKIVAGTTEGQLYCLDVHSGQLYWKFSTDGPLQSTPAIKSGRLFVANGKNTLFSFSF